MERAIFLDRDGTINIDNNYIYKISDFKFIEGAIEALKMFQNNKYKLIIITNQSGIAKGFFKEKDLEILNIWLKNELKQNGVIIDAIYYCPHNANDNCNCRKPKIGLFEKAIKEFNIDISKSYAIGDKLRDCTICFTTDCKGFLIGNNENKEIIDNVKKGLFKQIKYEETLLNCAKEICYK